LPDSAFKTAQMMFLGTALAITAVPVVVRVLMDLNKLDTNIGRSIVSAAVIDDVLSLMLLAILTGIISNGALPSITTIAILVFKVIVFFGICTALGKYVFPVFTKLLKKGEVEEGEFGGLLIMGFAFALLAEPLALHFIIGAFLAGLVFQKRHAGEAMFEKVEKRVYGVTSGFLAPIFFASIGLHVSFGALIETPLFTLGLLLLAIIGKVIGAGVPAYMMHKDKHEAAIIGVAMNGRGAVELIIVDIALRVNLFEHPEPVPPIIANMYSSIVIMAIVTTILTPLLLKRLLAGDKY
jgi:Kef-type K+ transport system membrane component KefB